MVLTFSWHLMTHQGNGRQVLWPSLGFFSSNQGMIILGLDPSHVESWANVCSVYRLSWKEKCYLNTRYLYLLWGAWNLNSFFSCVQSGLLFVNALSGWESKLKRVLFLPLCMPRVRGLLIFRVCPVCLFGEELHKHKNPSRWDPCNEDTGGDKTALLFTGW